MERNKLAPLRPPSSPTDIFVSRRSNDCVLYKKSLKLLDRVDTKSITLHGLGAAIEKATILALKIQKRSNGAYRLDISTSSVELMDMVSKDPENLPEAGKFVFSSIRFSWNSFSLSKQIN
mmetsp:Transcript_21198/g.29196  ORF Transcript_21198/g.29196 Transcript_21198/m.29196 type:complete len:120 (-) Transcript_21198:639-998(-)